MKQLLKWAFNALALPLSGPFWIPARVEAALTGGESWFNAGSQFLSLIPGKTGIFIRRGFYRMCLEGCSDDVQIGFGTTISHPQVRIGIGVYIGNRCTIGKAVIEDHVTIGCNVDILSGRRQHCFADPNRPIQTQGGEFKQIVVGANTWIGNSSVVMAEIGAHCVVGAGTVVVKPVPDASVVVGNPARLVRSLDPAPSSGLRLEQPRTRTLSEEAWEAEERRRGEVLGAQHHGSLNQGDGPGG